MDQKEYDKWLNYAMYLLSFKMRTIKEMQDKFISKQVDEEIQQLVLAFLIEQRLVDDVFYAQSYIESRQSKYGEYRMKQALKQKGISEQDFMTALDNLEETLNPKEAAKKILSKKIDTMAIDYDRLESDYTYRMKTYQKLAQFLAYRGFSGDLIKSIVGEVLNKEFLDE